MGGGAAQEVADGVRSLLGAVARALLCEAPPPAGSAGGGLPRRVLELLLEGTQAMSAFERLQEQCDAEGAVAGAGHLLSRDPVQCRAGYQRAEHGTAP